VVTENINIFVAFEDNGKPFSNIMYALIQTGNDCVKFRVKISSWCLKICQKTFGNVLFPARCEHIDLFKIFVVFNVSVIA